MAKRFKIFAHFWLSFLISAPETGIVAAQEKVLALLGPLTPDLATARARV